MSRVSQAAEEDDRLAQGGGRALLAREVISAAGQGQGALMCEARLDCGGQHGPLEPLGHVDDGPSALLERPVGGAEGGQEVEVSPGVEVRIVPPALSRLVEVPFEVEVGRGGHHGIKEALGKLNSLGARTLQEGTAL